MNDIEIKRLKDLAKRRLKNGVSREEALKTFMAAGILNKKGEYTKDYKTLAKATA